MMHAVDPISVDTNVQLKFCDFLDLVEEPQKGFAGEAETSLRAIWHRTL